MSNRTRTLLACATVAGALVASTRTFAGQTEAPKPAQTNAHDEATPPPGTPSANPDPVRPNANRERNRHPRVFDLRPQFYRDRYGYRYGIPAFEEVRQERLESAYREGYAVGRSDERFEIRAERGLAAFQAAMAAGHQAFTDGAYGPAAREFLLACTLNQGDPAARVCAANAQFALREYESAARLVERALELQPRMIYLPIDIRAAYGRPDDFESHMAALRRAADDNPDDGDLWFLLGYYHYYSGRMAKSADALQQAAALKPGNRIVSQLLDLARPRGKAEQRAARGTSQDPPRNP